MPSNFKKAAAIVTVSDAQLAEVQAQLKAVPNGYARAVAGAINKALAKGKTTAVDEFVKLLTAKRKHILASEKGEPRFALYQARKDKLVGILSILSRRLSLINFKHKDTTVRQAVGGPGRGPWGNRGVGSGVTFQIYKAGPSIRAPHAFVATGLSGNPQIFKRKPGSPKRRVHEAHYKKNIGRMMQPLVAYRGVSLLKIYRERPEVERAVLTRMQAEIGTDLKSQIDRLLNRKKSDRPA